MLTLRCFKSLGVVKFPIYVTCETPSNLIRRIFKKDLKKELTYYHYFSGGYDRLTERKIYSEMLLYLFQVKEVESLAQFGTMINYSLRTIENLYQIKRELTLDIDAEIEKASSLFKEINIYARSIEQSVENKLVPSRDLGLDEFLQKHNKVMDNHIDLLKLLNSQ